MRDRTSTKSSLRFPHRPIVLLDAFANMVLAAIIVAGDPPVETLSEWPHRDQRVDAAVMTDRVAALLAGAVDIEPCALRDVGHLPRASNNSPPNRKNVGCSEGGSRASDSQAAWGGPALAFLVLLGCFLVEQGQQHLVPILVAFRIALALGDQPPIEIDVCVVDVILHGALRMQVAYCHGAKGLTCSILNTRARFLEIADASRS